VVNRASEPFRHGDDPLAAAVWRALEGVADPEIPVLNVVEMGLIRRVEVADGGREVTVTITPTFSGCPALQVIEDEVAAATKSAGAGAVKVRTTMAPPWSTDDMTDEARRKLEAFGIAPPAVHGGLLQIALDAPVRCPHCGHPDTRVRNTFGSTLCREIRTCVACQETFERFKPL
jgi:ring-1,2-phenylacetyl-CoA epoxidase subunit PaaD